MIFIALAIPKLYRTLITILRFTSIIKLRIKSKINWQLIYGVERSGTSLMLRLLGTSSLRIVSDWGLKDLLKLTPNYSYITFDREKALRDISGNILKSAVSGNGIKLDLVYKQASIDVHEFKMLVKMWGNPGRKIFCIREPSSYIASAIKKFPNSSLSHLQSLYIKSFSTYEHIKGDIFEYSESLSAQDYLDFLSPLVSPNRLIEQFHWSGSYKPKMVSQEMWIAYQKFKRKNISMIFP